MLLNEVWPETPLQLDEAGLRDHLRNLAAAGAMGAGLLGGYGGASLIHGPQSSLSAPAQLPSDVATRGADLGQVPQASARDQVNAAPSRTPSPSVQQAARTAPMPVRTGNSPHSNFPRELHGQSEATRNDRIQNFTLALRPLIAASNAAILTDRSRILHISREAHPSSRDVQWIESIADRYDVPFMDRTQRARPIREVVADLLLRVDVIPEVLAISQAALESGWGTSDLTRQGNNFFGQRATGRHQQHQRIRNIDNQDYRFYDSPQHSIQSYMHNLNTHPSYRDFRQVRAQLRRRGDLGQERMAAELSKHLGAYSTNQEYQSRVSAIMSSIRNIHEDQEAIS